MLTSKFISTVTAITLLTWGIGVVAPRTAGADMDHDPSEESAAPAAAMPHGGDHGDHDRHSHGMLSIPAGQPVPEVVVDIFPDPVAGWNLQVQTANWTFAPEAVNTTSNLTEGHAHLYVNGEKVTRIYSEWHYIPSLPPGEHVLTVGLNANGHERLMYDGEPIAASVKVVVPESAEAR